MKRSTDTRCTPSPTPKPLLKSHKRFVLWSATLGGLNMSASQMLIQVFDGPCTTPNCAEADVAPTNIKATANSSERLMVAFPLVKVIPSCDVKMLTVHRT